MLITEPGMALNGIKATEKDTGNVILLTESLSMLRPGKIISYYDTTIEKYLNGQVLSATKEGRVITLILIEKQTRQERTFELVEKP